MTPLPRRPSVARCLATVAATRLSLKLLGLRRTVVLARRLGGNRGARANAPAPIDCARSVATAAAFFPGRAVCLEQAIALFVVLRRLGYPAALRIGVQPLPFLAHAWIELGGRPLFEAEATSQFVPFPEALA